MADLINACFNNNQELAFKLIESGADVNAGNYTPLHWACKCVNQGIIKKLVMHGVIINYTNEHIKKHQPFIESIKWSYKEHTEWPQHIRDVIETILMIARSIKVDL